MENLIVCICTCNYNMNLELSLLMYNILVQGKIYSVGTGKKYEFGFFLPNSKPQRNITKEKFCK